MKKLLYKNKDITSSVDILGAFIHDNAGDKADKIQVILSDIDKVWREYPPIKGDSIKLIYNNFDSGVMYIDDFQISRGTISIGALSTPLGSKISRNVEWENISFKQLAKSLTEEIGLNIEFFNISDYSYNILEQKESTNMEFLNNLCILEGYRLKVFDGKCIIYDERYFESLNPIATFGEEDLIGYYNFKCKNSRIYNSCTITYGEINYTFRPMKSVIAPNLIIDNLKISNLGEAERFSRNLLRSYNKTEFTGNFKVNSQNVVSGSTINIVNLGTFNEKYFVEEVTKNSNSNISTIKVRKVLEGY